MRLFRLATVLVIFNLLSGSIAVWAKGGDFQRKIDLKKITLGGNAAGIIGLCDGVAAQETYRHRGGLHYLVLQGVLRDKPEIHIALVDSARAGTFEVSVGSVTLRERLHFFENRLRTFPGWSVKMEGGVFVNGARLQYQILAKRKHSYRITHGLDFAEHRDNGDWKLSMVANYPGPLELKSIIEILQRQEAIVPPYRFARLWDAHEPFRVETGGQEDVTTTFTASKKALEEVPQLSMGYNSRDHYWKVKIEDLPLTAFVQLFQLSSLTKQMGLPDVSTSHPAEIFVVAESSWTNQTVDMARLPWTGSIWSYEEHVQKWFSIPAR